LKDDETIDDAKLVFSKQGGPKSVCEVKITKCDYTKESLSYSNRPLVVNTVSKGASFPEEDGVVEVPLDKQLIGAMMKKAAKELCFEVTGGGVQPVFIGGVHMKMNVKKQGGVANTKIKDENAAVKIDRRRRTSLADMRRRRSVQAVKDQAKEIWTKNELRYRPEFEREKDSKIAAEIEKRRLRIETKLQKKYVGIKELGVKQVMNSTFSHDKVAFEEDKLTLTKVETSLEKILPTKYETEKVNLKAKMEKDLTTKKTEAAEAELKRKSNLEADEHIKSEGKKVLDAAIKKKVDAEFPEALTAAVKANQAKDVKAAADVIIAKSVQEKTKTEVERQIGEKVKAKLKQHETDVAKKAASDAVKAKLDILIKQEIEKLVNKEKAKNSNLGKKTKTRRYVGDRSIHSVEIKGFCNALPTVCKCQSENRGRCSQGGSRQTPEGIHHRGYRRSQSRRFPAIDPKKTFERGNCEIDA